MSKIKEKEKWILRYAILGIIFVSMFLVIQMNPLAILYEDDFGVSPIWEEPVVDYEDSSILNIIGNEAPTAKIKSITPLIAEQKAGVYITFIGSSGFDSDGYIKRYQWKSALDGSTLSNKRKFTMAAKDLGVGTYKIKFRVFDDDGAASPWYKKTITIKALVVNKVPTAKISSISPTTAYQGKDMLLFRGYGEDSDGTVVGYKWSSNLDGLLNTLKDFETSADKLSIGTHTISFKVKDDKGDWSAKVTMTIVINEELVEDVDGDDGTGDDWWDDWDDYEDDTDGTDTDLSVPILIIAIPSALAFCVVVIVISRKIKKPNK